MKSRATMSQLMASHAHEENPATQTHSGNSIATMENSPSYPAAPPSPTLPSLSLDSLPSIRCPSSLAKCRFLLHSASLKLALFPDNSKHFIQGIADFTLTPISSFPFLSFNRLHSSHSYTVDQCFVNGRPSAHHIAQLTAGHYTTDADKAKNIARPNFFECRDSSLVEYYLEELADFRERGELLIKRPQEEKENTMAVRIMFHCDHNTIFGPVEPHTSPSFLFSSYSCCSPSVLFPCVDSLAIHTNYTIAFNMPAALQCFATGSLQSHTITHNRASYVFKSDTPLAARHLGFIVGRSLQSLKLSDSLTAIVEKGQDNDIIEVRLKATCSDAKRILSTYEEYLDQPYPYSHYSMAFFDRCYSSSSAFACLSFFPNTLFDSTMIEPVYSTLPNLAFSMALSWLSTAIFLDSVADLWLVHGLAALMADHYLDKAFGKNESMFNHLTRAIFVCEHDESRGRTKNEKELNNARNHAYLSPLKAINSVKGKGKKTTSKILRYYDERPLYWAGYLSESDMDHQLFRTKAAVVLRMLEERLGSSLFRSIVLKLLEESHVNESPERVVPLTTARFVEIAKELSNDADLGPFFDQWVYSSSYPLLQVYYAFNSKKRVTPVQISQIQPNLLAGILSISIHESERVSEQERRLTKAEQIFDFVCHSRVRRNRKRKQYDHETMRTLPVEKLLLRHNETPLLWVRVDAKQQWFRPIIPSSNELMATQQLVSERDIRGQWQGMQSLRRILLKGIVHDGLEKRNHLLDHEVNEELKALKLGFNALKDILLSRKHFYELRKQAARVLTESALLVDGSSTEVMAVLMSVFLINPGDPIEPTHQLALSLSASSSTSILANGPPPVRPNDFTDMAEYFLRLTVIQCLSVLVESPTRPVTPGEIVRFLLSLYKENDNTGNPMDDAYWRGELLMAFGNIKLQQDEATQKAELVTILMKAIEWDNIAPSTGNIITCNAYLALAQLEANRQLIRSPINYFASLSDPNSSRQIREAAWRCLLLLVRRRSDPSNQPAIHDAATGSTLSFKIRKPDAPALAPEEVARKREEAEKALAAMKMQPREFIEEYYTRYMDKMRAADEPIDKPNRGSHYLASLRLPLNRRVRSKLGVFKASSLSLERVHALAIEVDPEQARDELMAFKMTTSETIPQYAHRLQRLVKRTKDIPLAKSLVEIFYDGLLLDIRNQMTFELKELNLLDDGGVFASSLTLDRLLSLTVACDLSLLGRLIVFVINEARSPVFPGQAAQFANELTQAVIKGTCPCAAYQEAKSDSSSPHDLYRVHTLLWRSIFEIDDEFMRFSCYRLFQALYGNKESPLATQRERYVNALMQAAYKAEYNTIDKRESARASANQRGRDRDDAAALVADDDDNGAVLYTFPPAGAADMHPSRRRVADRKRRATIGVIQEANKKIVFSKAAGGDFQVIDKLNRAEDDVHMD